jgi:GntR family carbon starvation induced transcriptional regulator
VPTPPTLAEYVDGRLRAAILSGEIAPGEKLRSEHLATAWGVSPTPVREAFQRLAGEGMVVIEPQRGARVAVVDPVEAAELYELRLTLEPTALRSALAAAAGPAGDGYRAAVVLAHAELGSPPRTVAEYLAAHRAFHLAVLAGCTNARLHHLVVQLHDHTQRFQVAGVGYQRAGDPVAEHRALCDAVVAGDADAAVSVLEQHLAATLAAVQTLTR